MSSAESLKRGMTTRRSLPSESRPFTTARVNDDSVNGPCLRPVVCVWPYGFTRLDQVRLPAVTPPSVLPSPRMPWQPAQVTVEAGKLFWVGDFVVSRFGWGGSRGEIFFSR